MSLITAIDPTRASLAQFAAELPVDTPVVMLNLLRFNPQASDQSGRTGREAYAEYSRLIMPLLAAVGGQDRKSTRLKSNHQPISSSLFFF